MRRTMGLMVGALGALAVLLGSGTASTAQASQLVDIPIPDRAGEIPSQWLVRYPDGGPPRAKVLLPDGYDSSKSYPLLVLLIGLNSHYTDWSDAGEGEIEKTAKGFPGIIVMPEGGDGWYADWWNGGRRGAPSWESYVLDEVIPQTRERYKIRPERRYHALAGVSMGGLGTGFLGSRLPGFFGSIAVISGFVDTSLHSPYAAGASQSALSYAGAALSDPTKPIPPTDPYVIYGPPDGFYQRGHNPTALAANLDHTRVFMTTGDGTPLTGQLGSTGMVGQSEELAVIKPMSDDFAAALRRAGADLTYRVHEGYHDWNNFRPELQAAIAWGLFAPVVEHPTSWVNDTVATRGQIWNVGYRFDAPPDRLVRFERHDDAVSVGPAGSAVTLTLAAGCVVRFATPGSIRLNRLCRSAAAGKGTRGRRRARTFRAPG
jgi:S-formylglutathione hydrolase FrmB